ncbi:hypothetical protein PENTCL1PPCAC_2815, partial [Pristionchus entomophagus]
FSVSLNSSNRAIFNPQRWLEKTRERGRPTTSPRLASCSMNIPSASLSVWTMLDQMQMQEIRHSMRGQAVILMGKNTMIIKAIRAHMAKIPSLEILIPSIVKNVGFVFTKEDLSDIRDKLLENRKAAPAKAGSIAPCDVNIPPQNTGMGPEKTSFFQALQISTKIARGSIEILNEKCALSVD